MGKNKPNGKRAPGVQGKDGRLYIITNEIAYKDGKKCYRTKWVSTGLKDTIDNVRKVKEFREQYLNKTSSILDINMSLASLIDYFLASKKRKLRDTTYSAYCYRAKAIKKYFGDEVKLKDINQRVVEAFLDYLFIDNNMRPRSVKDIKDFFSSVLEYAVSEGVLITNYAKEAIISKELSDRHSVAKNDDSFFSYKEAQYFLDKIKDKPYFEMFYLTLFFGLRREELLGLRWSVVDFIGKKLTINHTVTMGTQINRQDSTKTESSMRTYPLDDKQIDMFKKLKDKENEYRRICGKSYQENDYIFKNCDGSMHYPDYPSKLFKKIIKDMPELPQSITLHGLRTSCVSILVHKGLDVVSVQKWVGHKDISTTLKIYSKVKERDFYHDERIAFF